MKSHWREISEGKDADKDGRSTDRHDAENDENNAVEDGRCQPPFTLPSGQSRTEEVGELVPSISPLPFPSSIHPFYPPPFPSSHGPPPRAQVSLGEGRVFPRWPSAACCWCWRSYPPIVEWCWAGLVFCCRLRSGWKRRRAINSVKVGRSIILKKNKKKKDGGREKGAKG